MRVVAHITADAVRVDLVGASDASRDVLRAALGDLRRDLADAGLNVQVGLGGSGPGQDGTQHRSGTSSGDGRAGSSSGLPAGARDLTASRPPADTGTDRPSRRSGLDVIA